MFVKSLELIYLLATLLLCTRAKPQSKSMMQNFFTNLFLKSELVHFLNFVFCFVAQFVSSLSLWLTFSHSYSGFSRYYKAVFCNQDLIAAQSDVQSIADWVGHMWSSNSTPRRQKPWWSLEREDVPVNIPIWYLGVTITNELSHPKPSVHHVNLATLCQNLLSFTF